MYINVHTNNFTNGEIRGQFLSSPSVSSIQFNATSYMVNESEGSATVAVTRIGNTTNAVTINYSTVDGSARSPADYITSSGTLQFAPGETIKSFSVPIIDDANVEGTENINLVLSAPGFGAVLGSPFTAAITVLDNDQPLILTEENTGRAVALDSVTMLRDPFPLDNLHNFSSDQHTRIMLFVLGIDLMPGEDLSALSIQAEDTQNRVYPLVVEDVRKVPNFDWLSQVVVRLPNSIASSGDFQVSISFRGTTGNKAVLTIIR